MVSGYVVQNIYILIRFLIVLLEIFIKMYLLENKNDGKVFYLLNQVEFIVGRKDCDILLLNDQSISRRHAVIRIKEDYATLEDCGSKYKTLLRDTQITPEEEIRLKNNDIIQFGALSSQFIFKQLELITAGTRLSSAHKTKLKKEIALLGGKFTENWTSHCTHLTVEEITLTVKVLHALIDEKPIVVPAYWTKFAENVIKGLPPPNIDEYRDPPMAEALLNKVEFRSSVSRKQLFRGKIFVFLKENSKKQMEDIIKKVGGVPISWEKDPMPLEDIISTPKEFLLIQTPDQEEDPSFNTVIKHFTKKGKRTIPLQEIAMAIVHGSCEKDCNPSFNRAEQVFPTTRAREPTQNNALAPNTESECFSMDICNVEGENRMIIPDTFDPTYQERIPGPSRQKSKNESTVDKNNTKRARSKQEPENPFKKMKLEKEKNVTSETMIENGESSKETRQEKKSSSFITKIVASQKRKAEEQPNENESKKPNKTNPFALIMKKSRNDPEPTTKRVNPFSLTKKKSSETTQISDSNPFKSVRRRSSEEKVSNVFTSTKLNIESPEKTLNYSRIPKTGNSGRVVTWLSKETPVEVKKEEKYDSEMQSFIDLFKNKIVIEVMSNTSLRLRMNKDITSEISYSGKNFKKFKKVRPLYPQSIIIGKENLVAKGPGETTGINDTRRVLHESDDESTKKVNKKRPPKKFVFE